MNPKKAIEYLEKDIKDFGGPGTSLICQAERLGIEALKFRLELEQFYPGIPLEPLPGETKD